MQFYDAVYRAAKISGLTMEQISHKLGKTASYITSSKARGSAPKVDNAAEILNACDFTLCAVPKDEVPEGAIVID